MKQFTTMINKKEIKILAADERTAYKIKAKIKSGK